VPEPKKTVLILMTIGYIVLIVLVAQFSYDNGYDNGYKDWEDHVWTAHEAGYIEGFDSGYSWNKSRGLDKFHTILINGGYEWIVNDFESGLTENDLAGNMPSVMNQTE